MLTIRYKFNFPTGASHVFDFHFDQDGMAPLQSPTQPLPAWSRLDVHQCSVCPLSVADTPHCPAAAALADVLPRLGRVPSHMEVRLDVIADGRVISEETVFQNALRSLIGLVMATSGCPHMRLFRPMARFHLPLSSETETLFRAAGSYLLTQYFRHRNGETVDLNLDGLVRHYETMQQINLDFAARMRDSGAIDEVNALAQLYTQSEMVPLSIRDCLADLMPLFQEKPDTAQD